MKTSYPPLVAIVVTIVFSGFVQAKPVQLPIVAPEVHFEVPPDVLNLTNPDSKILSSEFMESKTVTYVSMKEEISTKTKYGLGLSLINQCGRRVLLVANGKVVHFVRDGKERGMFIMSKFGESPIPYSWFEKYGDPLVIGMFTLSEKNNVITGGEVIVVRFGDLIDSDGCLRKQRFVIKGVAQSLERIRVTYLKPDYNNYETAPLVAMRPNVEPLVVPKVSSASVPNFGPVVHMNPIYVGSRETPNWGKIRELKGDDGKLVGLLVEHVTDGSPYAEAGLRSGMIIKSFEIVKGSPQGDLLLRILDDQTYERREILIPAERLRKAASKPVGEVIAAVTPYE